MKMLKRGQKTVNDVLALEVRMGSVVQKFGS